MEWYEIIGVVVIWVAGLWLREKVYERLRNRYFNDSWKKWGK